MIGNLSAGIFSPGIETYRKLVLEDNPIGFWLLDEASGATAFDSSTNAINATYQNSPSLDQAGTGGGILKSVFFDAAQNEGAYTGLNSAFNIAVNQAWSTEVWYKDNTTTSTNSRDCYTWRNDNGTTSGVHSLIAINTTVSGRVSLFATNSSASGYINLNYDLGGNTNWHHVVSTAAAGGTMRLYVDGVERASSTAARYNDTSNKRIAMSADWNGTQLFLFGTMNLAAVAIYNTELSASRVLDHYNSGI